MERGVSFIFRTLIKVPIIIMVSFFIFNIFAFTVSYFKVIGAVNAIQQVAIDNNFLPQEDVDTFKKYLEQEVETTYLQNAQIIINTDGRDFDKQFINSDGQRVDVDMNDFDPENTSVNERKQYGNTITVGVTAEYRFIWPLMHIETLDDGRVQVYGPGQGQANTGITETFTTADQQEAERQRRADSVGNITVVNKVMGMQYYSDLD